MSCALAQRPELFIPDLAFSVHVNRVKPTDIVQRVQQPLHVRLSTTPFPDRCTE